MSLRSTIAILLCAAGPAFAECPANPDIEADIDRLLDAVQGAESAAAARRFSNEMWTYWAKAPDEQAQRLLDDGMARRAAFDLAGAVVAFDRLIDYCPDYAEGYNQRAFANFIREDYAAALPDLERAIALRPRHVAAIAGKGLTLIQMGRILDGQEAIRAALEFNPWLSERQYLLIEPEGTDL